MGKRVLYHTLVGRYPASSLDASVSEPVAPTIRPIEALKESPLDEACESSVERNVSHLVTLGLVGVAFQVVEMIAAAGQPAPGVEPPVGDSRLHTADLARLGVNLAVRQRD